MSFLVRIQRMYPAIKRVIDILVSFSILITYLPLFLIIALLVCLTSKGPALFWSQRIGYNNEPFLMPKIRTMTVCSKVLPREYASEEDITITPIGLILRKSSLDDFPLFLSVLRGEMSLIGPQPLLLNDSLTAERKAHPEIFNVRPGMICLAKTNNRYSDTPRNKMRYDIFYSERMCLFLDAKILYRASMMMFKFKLVKPINFQP